jgi:hypothetical protein
MFRRLSPFLGLLLVTSVAHAAWQRTDTSLARTAPDGSVIWRFSFDPKMGKPFFDPLSVGGRSLTNFKPEDHPWHYGLWFSWKYVNGANYWEESRQTGKSEGATGWNPPAIEVSDDGRATITLDLTYTHPSGRVDVTERRVLAVSAPAADGSYAIDWRARFTFGPEGALLDRTPMPGEPDGRVNGGYAGLGVRLAGPPVTMSVVSVDGPVDPFENDRARPATVAIACNFAHGGQDIGGLAIISNRAANGGFGAAAPWYIVRSQQMHFACAAVLAPNPLRFEAGATWDLRYLLKVSPRAWTPQTLEESSRTHR